VELGGIAIVTLLGMLACPLLMVIAAVGRFLPWRQWTARLRSANARRMS
jgi:hypothetical protein